MTAPEVLGLVLGSAGVGALISSVVNGIFNWKTKQQELERQDMQMALKMAELRHQQLVAVHDWHSNRGEEVGIEFYDPLATVMGYCDGMKEYRKTGRWAKGEAGHQKPDAPKKS
jgi:hypothetical protein